jgi:hypothetical protein
MVAIEQGVVIVDDDRVAKALLKPFPQFGIRLGGSHQFGTVKLCQTIEIAPDVIVREAKHPDANAFSSHRVVTFSAGRFWPAC